MVTGRMFCPLPTLCLDSVRETGQLTHSLLLCKQKYEIKNKMLGWIETVQKIKSEMSLQQVLIHRECVVCGVKGEKTFITARNDCGKGGWGGGGGVRGETTNIRSETEEMQ